MLPTVDHLENDIFRVYYSGRDSSNRSVIGFSDIEVLNGKINVINDYDKEILNIGSLGSFDDNGVTPSCILNFENKKYLYYIGWNSGSTTRMSLIAGLAISNDNEGLLLETLYHLY